MTSSLDILIAEDNPADVRLMQEAFQSLSVPVNLHVARDGEQALQFLSQSTPFASAPKPQLVFLDFHLPKADARCVLPFIRQNPGLKDIPVIILTTSTEDDLVQEAYRLGANCYLSKPSDLEAFLYTVRSATEFWLNLPRGTA